ncbi:MAG: hypothetical protein HIU57_07495 [Acidobacteria bacterium]|nr:hypothetical protein [Acidobacteriota bacterium]
MKNMITGPKEHSSVRSVLRSALTHGAALAILATGLTFVAGTSASAVPTTPLADLTLHAGVGAHVTKSTPPGGGAQSPTSATNNAGRSPLVAQVAQSPLTLTSTSGVAGTTLTLTSSGGSGTGAVTYGVTNTGTAGCFITSDKLNATRAGTCTVTVTKAADSTYLAASSPATTVTFAPAALKVQSALTLTSTRGVVGTVLTLTSRGGSGTGAVTFAITVTGTATCLITNGKLSATKAGTCTVKVTKAGDATYLAASSPATTVTFAPAALKVQSALTLTSTRGVVGTVLTLTSRGGSGTGAVTFAITVTGTATCLITNGKLSATKAGTCTVKVTKAGDATYLAASSPATTVTFAPAALKVQSALTLTSTQGVVGAALTLTSSGGSGTGALTYAVTNTGTAGCWIANGGLNATRAGTCTVTVTKAGDATYQVARSSATTLVFQVKVVPVKFMATRVNGFVWVGRTSIVTITGSGFYSKPTIRSNQARTTATVIHDYGRALVVRVTLAPRSPTGWHVFTITLANGQSTQVRYLVK